MMLIVVNKQQFSVVRFWKNFFKQPLYLGKR